MKSAKRIKYFYETVISENQIERMAEFISPECCVKMGEKLIQVGIEGMKEHIKATKQTYPDYRMKIIKQFCDGDYVISEFIMEGTHKGEWIGIKPTGKRLVFTGVDIDKVIDGLIVEHGGAVNTFETLFEAGMIGAI
ncbi:ester cyclase [Enterocloster bolteae]|jgi:predicted ester cyclase|uniref:ester cyclase n=1 Tax=Enterocloster bolteae TaxID=208479 RepID=UPI0022DF62DB|nr:ester cyclase [Enterocloster bolteae]